MRSGSGPIWQAPAFAATTRHCDRKDPHRKKYKICLCAHGLKSEFMPPCLRDRNQFELGRHEQGLYNFLPHWFCPDAQHNPAILVSKPDLEAIFDRDHGALSISQSGCTRRRQPTMTPSGVDARIEELFLCHPRRPAAALLSAEGRRVRKRIWRLMRGRQLSCRLSNTMTPVLVGARGGAGRTSSTPTVKGLGPVPGRPDSNTDRPTGRLAPQGALVRSDPHSDRPGRVFPWICRPPGNAWRWGFASPMPVTREGRDLMVS